MQCLTEFDNPSRLQVVRRLLRRDGFALSGYGSNGNRVHVR